MSESLDQHYLEFTAKTKNVFAQFPHIEPLRHFIFRELLVQQHSAGILRSIGLLQVAKHSMQSAWLRGAKSCDVQGRSEVLIWVESTREVVVDALLPVYRELVSRGVKVQLVSYGGPSTLPASTLHFQYRPGLFVPAWTKDAWDALCLAFEELRCRALYRSFSRACGNVASMLHALQKTLDTVQPKVVMCAASNLIGGAALAIASRRKECVTLLLQHGMTQAFYTPLVTDYMLTWGTSSNETLTRLGIPRDRLIALGSPRHDSMRPLANGDGREALLRTLSLPDKPTFVFFSNGNDLVRNETGPIECAGWLEEVAGKQRDALNVVVRLHPNEDGGIYKHCRNLCLTRDRPDLGSTLGGCDVTGSLCSTVLYDALLYGKPVLQFYADGWPDLADNWRNNLAIRISSPSQLEHVLDHMCRGVQDGRSHNQDHKSRHVFANQGCASQMISKYVIDILHGVQPCSNGAEEYGQ